MSIRTWLTVNNDWNIINTCANYRKLNDMYQYVTNEKFN